MLACLLAAAASRTTGSALGRRPSCLVRSPLPLWFEFVQLHLFVRFGTKKRGSTHA
jgi:hypothetical protein